MVSPFLNFTQNPLARRNRGVSRIRRGRPNLTERADSALIEALVDHGVAPRRALVEFVHDERTPDFVSSPIFMTSPAR